MTAYETENEIHFVEVRSFVNPLHVYDWFSLPVSGTLGFFYQTNTVLGTESKYGLFTNPQKTDKYIQNTQT